MGRELDVARSALLASTVFAGGIALPIRADATPLGVVSILSALTLGTFDSGGLGASSATGAPKVAVFVGDTSTGSALLLVNSSGTAKDARVIGGAVVIGNSLGDTRASAHLGTTATLDISGGSIQFARSSLAAISLAVTDQVVSGGVATSTGVTGGSVLISAGQTSLTTYDSGGGVVVAANVSSGGTYVGNVASTLAAIVNSGLVSTGSSSKYIDVTVNGSTGNGSGVNIGVTSGGIGTGRQQFIVVDVTTELTTALTLSAENSSDYFFVYLTSGISAGGVITTGTADGVAPDASHIITVIGANPTGGNIINGTQQGSFFYTGAGTVTVNGTIDGGIFLANATTSASELLLNGNALISANSWNGYFAASTDEPASLAAVATGVLGLGAVRRRKRRVSIQQS